MAWELKIDLDQQNIISVCVCVCVCVCVFGMLRDGGGKKWMDWKRKMNISPNTCFILWVTEPGDSITYSKN